MNRRLQVFYQQVVSSIAFLPAIISLLFFLLSIVMVYFEFPFIETSFVKSMQVLLLKGNDNARHVLGALIGGIISLTVFSFSMVMLLLNQASSSFSPRILPGLLTDKKHQFVLGFYIGTIIYCIIIILNITPGEASQNSPKFGVLLAMVFGIVCLALFIYFIHLISQKIHVDTIISQVTRKSIKLIENTNQPGNPPDLPFDASSWYVLTSIQSGYLSQINIRKLEKIGQENHMHIQILYPMGSFLLENTIFCKTSQNIEAKKNLQVDIHSCFTFSYEPYGETSYLHGVNQLSEIAVKALSPGINDPGTALIALDHLSKVFCCLYQQTEVNHTQNKIILPCVIQATYSLKELLFNFIHPIAHYGKSDAKVHARLLKFYTRLFPLVPVDDQAIIYRQIEEEIQNIEKNITSSAQIAMLKSQVKPIFTHLHL